MKTNPFFFKYVYEICLVEWNLCICSGIILGSNCPAWKIPIYGIELQVTKLGAFSLGNVIPMTPACAILQH